MIDIKKKAPKLANVLTNFEAINILKSESAYLRSCRLDGV